MWASHAHRSFGPHTSLTLHFHYHYRPFIRLLALARVLNPFAPGDFAEKCVLKLVEQFSGHCCAIKS